MLNLLEYAPDTPPQQPPLLIAHGLFGSARNWGVIAKRMAATRRVVCVDMRNHAGSFWSDEMSYGAMGADLTQVLEMVGEADLLGHSMGGKAAMMAALGGAPVRRLVVADIAPVRYGHTQLHLIDAMEALDLGALATRGAADAALSAHVDDPTVRAFLLQSLDIKSKTWRLNLPVLRAEMEAILGFPPVAGRFEGPVLLLSGALSEYVLPAHRGPMKALFPKVRFAKIKGANHWLHAEKPREFEAALTVFLEAET